MSATRELGEYEAIEEVVQRYLEGARLGRSDIMETAFHDGATIFGYFGQDLLAGPIQLLLDWNRENGPAKGLQARIVSLDLVGTAATVRLEVDDWTGHRFTDLFTLLKVDGAWRVTNKVFHLHAANA